MDIYALAISMGTGNTSVEVSTLLCGLTVVLAFVVDPEDPREVFCDPAPLSSDWLCDFRKEFRRLLASVLWREASKYPNLDSVMHRRTNRIYTSSYPALGVLKAFAL